MFKGFGELALCWGKLHLASEVPFSLTPGFIQVD